jgi:hypothetical protein
MLNFADSMGFYNDHYRMGKQIVYTAMTLFHVYLKLNNEDETYDNKLLLLACLRISAVIYDIEFSQDKYTKVYYESVSKAAADINIRSPTSTYQSTLKISDNFIQLDKITGKLREKFMKSQSKVFEKICYQFNFKTPFECMDQFWEKLYTKIKTQFAGEKSKRGVQQDAM